ncbi:MAG: alpha/beta hydrolase [Microcoleus sp. PH2017_29_MFU_D_A]|uniref:alpha/beta fold hydrolase n=1 Tax=unclassified Microcoleus TaxID=2642155 RepID=UPI001DB803B4|nr:MULTISPECIES: alpha/beta hydrolase [unclassified Microcoleus]MCC3417242.1 alpha/beta hydrolase [Microcoleus sp. PH2017_07_MST_O_A]MCC3430493.1 alpha/beta hydrolase [Microcoleus sp. PH2017_04_SCI_O_A]MCC3444531.1 alpha/beta hydrolase [Microcoleus sp. PH2017_03_ELD_O_A]MCC3467838.1 alpha/beta hydrolase [Microcoleus sp. PH2017_06_SFM_O_A]MCC3506664.1 alpha/beta hydrolase [Microcoleus sp. PH2017_19_SFW_U_A]TAE15452.1 MAG: alpha/beta hydrolase [Oscillatoriales cyanobacterium]
MSFISVRGVEHYYEWITADNSAQPSGKPVMVFLHGWAGSARYWESTAQAIANDFDCLLYDMRGFGRSPLPPSPPESSYELETYARDLAELLEALNLSRVFLNAHSTGASIATLFLNLYPEKVEKAILTCSGIFEYDEKAFTTFHKFGGYVVKFRPSWLAAIPFADRIFMARFLRQSLPTAVSLAFLKDFLMADEEAAIGTMVTAVSKRAAEEMPQEFARLSVPTLLVAGEFDQIIPAAMGEQAASLSKKVEFVIIPNTAHFPMLEDAATYLQLIRDFLPAAA